MDLQIDIISNRLKDFLTPSEKIVVNSKEKLEPRKSFIDYIDLIIRNNALNKYFEITGELDNNFQNKGGNNRGGGKVEFLQQKKNEDKKLLPLFKAK